MVQQFLGNLWKPLETFGTFGNIWKPLDIFWKPLETFGNIWKPLERKPLDTLISRDFLIFPAGEKSCLFGQALIRRT